MKLVLTICSTSYLGQAKTMADSLCLHNPDYHVVIGLMDRLPKDFDLSPYKAYDVLEVEKLNIPTLHDALKKYNVLEICGWGKIFYSKYLFEKYPEAETILYFDCDMMIYHTFEAIEEELQENDIILTPHIFSPYKDDEYPREYTHLNTGLYNAGFFGMKRSKTTFDFLDWFENNIDKYAYIRPIEGLFAEQIWLNLVPLFFEKISISKNLGFNVAYWNLHERRLSQNAEGKYFINENTPLTFFHFSGYNSANPDQMSVYNNRYSLINRPEFRSLFDDFAQKLSDNKHQELLKFPNLLIPKPWYLKLGKLRGYIIRIAIKTLKVLHG